MSATSPTRSPRGWRPPGREPQERFLNFVYAPTTDDAGRVTGIFVEGYDVTETHHAQQALRTREHLQALLLTLNDRLSELVDEGDLSYAVGEFLGQALHVDRAGYGTVDAAAQTISIVRDWNAPGIRSLAGVLHFPDYGSYIDDLLRGETVVFADARTDARTAASAARLESISARSAVNMPVMERGELVALLYLNHGTARHWSTADLELVRDVAQRARTVIERRRAEQDLRNFAVSLEQQVAARTAERDRVWRYSRDLLVVVGVDGTFRAANSALQTILGHDPPEVIGRPFMDFVWPDDRDSTRAAFAQAVRQGSVSSFENRYTHRDGSFRWLSWSTQLEGELIYGYARDVTVEKAADDALRSTEEKLRQAQKMEAVGQLTGGLAHDFNNLLAGISGSLELVKRLHERRLPGVDKYVDTALASTRRAATLTQRLLAFSRRQTLEPKPTDVNRLVASMEDLVRRTMGPDITVEVVGAGGLWLTKVDPPQLENALLNLCLNARDAMGTAGGRLTIETANKWLDERAASDRDLPPGQYISLCVTDTGSGMDAEVVSRAFDPFFTTKPLGEGTGLGLSMVYGFARQSGGQVRIYSEIGRGTTMCIYLPRFLGSLEPADPPEAFTGAHSADGETILVIDDDATVRLLLKDVLSGAGYRVIEAADGPSGVSILGSLKRVDLLITDVGLPGGMNGRQVADAARTYRPQLKVLFITGYAENAAIGSDRLGAGMHILTKPFGIAALEERVHALMNR